MAPDRSLESEMSRWFSDQRNDLKAPPDLWEELEPRLGPQDVAPAWQRLFGFRWAVRRLTMRIAATAAVLGLFAVVAVIYVALSETTSDDRFASQSESTIGQEQWRGIETDQPSAQTARPTATTSATTVAPPVFAATATAAPASAGGLLPIPPVAVLDSRTTVAAIGDVLPIIGPGGSQLPSQITREQAQEIVTLAVSSSGYGITPDQQEEIVVRLMNGDWSDLQDAEIPLDLTFFQNYGVNPFVDVSAEPISTFSMDVDTASYTVGRGYLDSGRIPPPASVRVEEYINYFDQDYPPAIDALDGHIEGALSPYSDDGTYLLRVGVSAIDVDPFERRSANIVLVIDTSGSMSQGNRISLVQQGIFTLLDSLREGDTVGVVTYSTQAMTQLRPTGDLNEARSVVSRLHPDGSTNAQAGLRLGFTLAEENFADDKSNHVILLSDGVANVGTTEPGGLLDDISEFARDGIFLSTVGVGLGNFNDVLLEQLANRGDGSYAYIDTAAEARKVLGTDITGLLEIVARDAKVQLEFDEAAVESYRLVGYENRSLETEQFRDDSIDAGEIGAGHTVTAMYELKLKDGAADDLGVVRLRWLDPETGAAFEKERDISFSEVDRPFESASPRFRFTSSVMAVAEILRRSPFFVEVDPLHVVSTLAAAVADLESPSEERELLSLLNTAIELGVLSND